MMNEKSFSLKTLIPELAALVSLSRMAASPIPNLERRITAMRSIEVIPIASAIKLTFISLISSVNPLKGIRPESSGTVQLF